jgi:hypothetical protein
VLAFFVAAEVDVSDEGDESKMCCNVSGDLTVARPWHSIARPRIRQSFEDLDEMLGV